MDSDQLNIANGPNDGRKVFKKLGTCSRTFFHILNREFGHIKELEEEASGALAGGIMQEGEQCGMLWGASLAVGAEAYRSCENQSQAIATAVIATQQVMNSFTEREHTINCKEITHCDFGNKWSFAKYMITGRFLHCFKMAQEWAPQAVHSAKIGLTSEGIEQHQTAMSCATQVAKKMGASDEQMIMVAGFAGGLGLSGGGCGALAAAVWMKSLTRVKEENEKFQVQNPEAKKTLQAFYKTTNNKILCSEITNENFNDLDDHTQFLKNGGCADLIDVLAGS
jgi:hypothetical protein